MGSRESTPNQQRAGSDHLKALTQRPAARKSAQICALWPDISAALAAGHTIADVREALALDGIEISYSKLRTYVARLKRQTPSIGQPGLPAGEHTPPTPTASTPPATPDPLFNVRRQLELKKKTTFEYNPFPDPKDNAR